MIDELKPYEKYHAAVAGLPPLPAHWAVRRTKSLLREIDRRSKTGTQPLLSLRMNTGLVDHHAMGGKHIPSSSLVGYKHVLPGELVMNRMRAAIGLFGGATSEGLVSPDYAIFDVRPELKMEYAVSLFKSPMMASLFRQESRGLGTGESGFLRLYSDRFGIIRMPLPPPDEQAAIVRFLAHANRRIDQFIRAKKKLIALLNEQKQAIIHRAVTRGLDPKVKLKDSGIPWLADVPAHWEVTRVKGEFGCLNSHRVPLNAPERGRMKRRDYDYYGASGAIDKVDDYIFDDELLLIAEDGANLVLRNLPLAIIARGKFWVNNHAHILKPRRGRLEYLANYMETLNYRPWITGAAQPKLTKDRLMSIAICVAPTAEQHGIDAHVDAATAPLRIALATADREVAFAREYRTRLISDVVTGQFDVRAAAAKLPDLKTEAPKELEADEDTDLEEDDNEAA
jgi:type I restriction enzyme S subunit